MNYRGQSEPAGERSKAETSRNNEDGGLPSPMTTSGQQRWFVYLIECSNGSIYTGIAVDVTARYAAHASGKGARYTRSHPPVRLLACAGYSDRSSASKAEYRIKQMKAADKRRFAAALAHQPLKECEPPAPEAHRTGPVATEQGFPASR